MYVPVAAKNSKPLNSGNDHNTEYVGIIMGTEGLDLERLGGYVLALFSVVRTEYFVLRLEYLRSTFQPWPISL
jgi:carbohydrate-selective porin OprB